MSPRTFLFGSLAIGLALSAVKLANASSEPTYSAIVHTQDGGSDIVDYNLSWEDCVRMFVAHEADECRVEQ